MKGAVLILRQCIRNFTVASCTVLDVLNKIFLQKEKIMLYWQLKFTPILPRLSDFTQDWFIFP